jgi:hypothetical protein
MVGISLSFIEHLQVNCKIDSCLPLQLLYSFCSPSALNIRFPVISESTPSSCHRVKLFILLRKIQYNSKFDN